LGSVGKEEVALFDENWPWGRQEILLPAAKLMNVKKWTSIEINATLEGNVA